MLGKVSSPIDNANGADGLRSYVDRLSLFINSDDDLVGDEDVLRVRDEIFFSIVNMNLECLERTILYSFAYLSNLRLALLRCLLAKTKTP